jgi:PAS domain S-box-containing protein
MASTALKSDAYIEEALRWTQDPVWPAELVADFREKPVNKLTLQDGRRRRVLLADDNADMRDYVHRLLSEWYEVESVADGRAALEAVARRPPDLVLADVMMPRLDGFGLLQALRSDPQTQTLPVVLLSARAGEESRVEGLDAGADDYLVKPFSARELLARVNVQMERKQSEKALREREAQLQTLFNEAPLGIYLVDADFRIKQVNPTALPVFGDLPNLIGRDFDEVIHILWPKAYADEIVQRFRHTLETGEPYFVPERIEERRDRGVTEYYEWQINRIPLPDGSYGVVCYFRDISAQVLARQALQEADRHKDEFLAMLSHELRNPLAPISNALQLLRLEQGYTSIQQEALSALDRQVGNLTRLVDDMLDVSRVTMGRIQLQQEDVDLNALVQSVADSFRPQMAERRHQFWVSLSGPPLWVHADPTRLEQVVVNLLSNAAKYTPQGGRVWLRVLRQAQPRWNRNRDPRLRVHRGANTQGEREGGDVAIIWVKDSGIGIEAGLLPHIFELFSQEARTLDRSEGGLGIGLALVKSLVEMHGGTVTARSQGLNKGSEFIVRLPAVPSPEPLPGPPPQEPDGLAARSLRVLLVDDLADTRKIFGRLLELLGNQVCTAHDGPSALVAALEFRPDVVLLDIGLPGMSGYEVAQRIRQEPALQKAVLVAVTGYGEKSDRQRSQKAGFDHHLVKPPDVDALRQLFSSLTAA